MSSESPAVKTVYSDRAELTAEEKAAIDSLNASWAAVRMPEGYEAITEVRKSLAKETREALKSAIPDLEERGRAQRERIAPELERLKGTAWQPLDSPVMRRAPSASILPGDDGPSARGVIFPPPHHDVLQPAHVGELWRSSVGGFSSDPGILYDVDQDPPRIFGHAGYTGDALLNGTVGLAMTFTLPPGRMEYTNRTVFAVDPTMQILGLISGYTGYYHPIFAADDKWAKCWESVEVTVTLSSGEWLAGNSLSEELTDLQNVFPVGMSDDRRAYGWMPGPLRFTANMQDLRERGVSIILRAAIRYDFQLEGESDLWFRYRSGSASESVPAVDNALTFSCRPGVVTSVP
ncbi:hypothetical protein ACIGXF_33915 [Streptomyces sp. NPDC053086]|uniref:hypothetical protein n=1 Tax=unclassified Streptomyces TaxID=2593676 RepID=UPI0036F7746F